MCVIVRFAVPLCWLVLAVPSADAAQKKPGVEQGSVSCRCKCEVERSEGAFISGTRYVGGEGNWRGTRAECRAFEGSACKSHAPQDPEGKLKSCDTVVHNIPGRLGPARKAPQSDKVAPVAE